MTIRRGLFLAAGLCLWASGAGAEEALYVTDYMAPQTVEIEPLGGRASTTAHLFATPGEYEPVSFAFRPEQRLEEVFITAGDLRGDGQRIPSGHVRIQSVESFHGGGRDILMDLGHAWDMPAYQRELFWVTVHVPPDAKAGLYRGKVTVTSQGREVATLDLELEVLPFSLSEPPYALGFNYSSPKDPEVLAAHLADMREHGMTSVAPLYEFHLPINDEDTSELGTFIQTYLRAGFTKPIYFATPMGLFSSLAGYGPVDTLRFQRKYLEVMRRMWAETQRQDVPVIFSIADELTNQALPGIQKGEKLARLCFEELPEICVTSDMNGYLEVMTMAPYLPIAAFNNGWDGIDHHNKGRRLINREFLLELQQKTGAIPWFVNAGVGRFPFGFFFWKMAKYGVKGKVEWYYNLGENRRGSVVRVEGRKVWPTLDYERSREGIDDLRYVLHLEALVSRAKKVGQGGDALARAEGLLAALGDSIINNRTAYTRGGEKFPSVKLTSLLDRDAVKRHGAYQAVRRAVADAILRVQLPR